MVQKRRLAMWAFAAAGIAAFVLGASAQEVVRVISQGVVTPGDPIWAQDPPAPPGPQEGDTPPDNAGGGRGNQAGRGETRRRSRALTTRSSRQAQRPTRASSRCIGSTTSSSTRFPKSELGKDFLWVTQIKRTVNGAGLRRSGRRQSRRALGTLQQPRSAARCRLQHRRRSVDPIAQSCRRCEQSVDRRALQRRRLQSGREIPSSKSRSCSRPTFRNSPSAVRSIGGRGMDASTNFHREGCVVPGEHQRRGHADVHGAARWRRAPAAGWRRTRARRAATASRF